MVSGKVTDALSGVASLVGHVDAGVTFPVAFDAAGNFSFSTTLALDGTADGSHTIHLVATDRAGNVSGSFDDTFVLDTRPPVVTYATPAPGSTARTNPTVSGKVTDALSGVALLVGHVDTGATFPVTFDASGNFSFTTSLALDGSADGSHTIHLVATDQSGNTSTAFDDTFVLDTRPPVVTYATPAPGSTARTNPTISGKVTDALSGVATLVGHLDAGATFPVTFDAAGNFSFTTALALDGTADGSHTVHLVATDKAGNVSGSFDDTFVLDTRPPVVTYTAPASGSTTDTNPTVSGKVTDALSGVASLVGHVDTGATFPVTFDAAGNFSFTTALALDGTADGSHTVHLVATDKAGNVSGSFDDTFVLDTTSVIADPSLAAAIRSTLGLPSNQRITKTVLLRLTTLSADSNTVTSLAGLQFATNLTSFSLVPSDWSLPGHVADLSPLSGLSGLRSLSLVGAGIASGELAALSPLSGLQALDLRYDPVSDVSAVAALPSLTSLRLYADPVTNLSPLAGKLVNIDIPPANPDGAKTVADLANALHELPITIFQYVVDNFTYQAYAGAKKGPQAALETKSGDDWDLDTLLAGLLGQAGVTTRYVSGTVEVPTSTVMNWLGVTDPGAAGLVLANAGLHPVQLIGPGGQSVSFRFDHTWVEAQLAVPGKGTQWVDLDPSWKFKDYSSGVANVLSLVPFNEQDYLSKTRPELTYEYYENQVASYLAAHLPGVSLADVAYDGPIHPQVFTALPSALPYTVVGTTTTAAQVPDVMTHRVGLTLEQGGTTLFSKVYELPQISLERVTVGYASAAGGLLTPELLLDGTVVAQGPAVANRSGVTLVVDHYLPGSAGVSDSFSYDREAGQYLAVGLDAGQLGDAYLARQQRDINAAAVAARDGTPFSTDAQVGAFLDLAISTYFHNSDVAAQVTDGLTHAVPVFNHVASGIATGEKTVTYHWDLQNPAIPGGVNVDVANAFHQEFALDNNTANDVLRGRILGDDGSAEEHAVWEQVANTTGISAIKSIQLANERGIPVFTITSANASTLIPQLTIDPSTVAAIQADVSAGATVTVPRDPTPLNNWRGVGYITRSATGEGYIIAGGLASQSSTAIQGGSGTGDPLIVIFDPGNPDCNQTFVGDPVNIANGDVNQGAIDVLLPGNGMSLAFSRRYDSQNTTDVGLGVGWAISYSDYLSFSADGSIVWTGSQEHKYTFTPDGRGGYIVPAPIFGTFTASATAYTFRAQDGEVYQFDTNGRLVEIRDRNGNAQDIAYDASGHMKSVTEAGATDHQLLFTYTGNHITAISDGTGRTWTYTYSGNELVRVDYPSDAQTPQETFRYDYYTDTALGGLLRQVTEPNGGTSQFAYYANRRAYQVSDPDGFTYTYDFNLYRDRTGYIDERGNTTLYSYNSAGDLVALQHPDRARESSVWQNNLEMSHTDVFGQTYTYQYDTLGNLTRMTDRAGNVTSYTYDPTFSQVTSVTQPDDSVTTNVYDAKGNLIKTTDPSGAVTTISYDSNGRVTSVTKPLGNLAATPGTYTTTYTYNDAGQMLTISTDFPSAETFTYDARGNRLSDTDALGNTTFYTYDLLGHLIGSTDALGSTSTDVYDAMGNVLASTDNRGLTMTYTYDSKEQLVKTTRPDGSIVTQTFDPAGNLVTQSDELGQTTTTVFDNRNRAIATVYADGTTTETRYDGGGRVIGATDQNGNISRYAYDKLDELVTITDALGGLTRRAFDVVGNLISITDPLNHTTQYQYDPLNRVTATIDPLGNATRRTYDADGEVSSVTDALNQTTRYTYDVLGRKRSTTDPLNQTTTTVYDAVGNLRSVTDPSKNTTTYTYDKLNRVVTETDALGNSSLYTYDVDNNLVSKIDRDGRETLFVYDKRDRLTTETWVGSNESLQYTYNPTGTLASAIDANSSLAFTYDALNEVKTSDNAGTPGVPHVVLTYGYDSARNLVGVADSINGQPDSVISYTYDPAGDVTRIIQSGPNTPPLRVDLKYNKVDQVASITRYSDLAGTVLVAATSYSYDDADQLVSLTHRKASSVIDSETLTYDAVGRITQLVNGDGTTQYHYDQTNQLTAANSTVTSDPTEAYSYDASGNRVSSGGNGNAYVIGAGDRLLSDGTFNYQYDKEGNLIQRTEIATGNVRVFQWDYRNRLIGIEDKDAQGNVLEVENFTYDALNRRVSTLVRNAVDTVLTSFVNDRDNVLLEFVGKASAGNLATPALAFRYLHAPAVDQVLAQIDGSGKILWLLSNHLGSTTDLVDNTGAVVSHITYDSFGNVVAQTHPENSTQYLFSGQQFDAATGLGYFRARYYDPQVGRFISQDPLGVGAGLGVNPFTLVQNNVVNQTDPSGLAPIHPKYNQTCAKLERLMNNLRNAIDQKLQDLEEDKLNLPETCPGAPRRDTKEGHREIIQELQDQLAAAEEAYARLCNAPEPEPEPEPGPNYTPFIIIIGIGIGIGLGIIFAPEITIPVLILSPAGL
jgi:RHS repeat-associated protein